MESTANKVCKYCLDILKDCIDEGFTCSICAHHVHLKCLKSGVVPGTLYGDLFFVFTCQDCSSTKTEIFVRDKIPWSSVVVLVLYHLQNRSPGLGRKGFYHWRHHVAALIDKNWEAIFPHDFKRKKKWIGTIAGTLSHFSYFFKSGTSVVNEQAWWSLNYPKLTPKVLSNMYSLFMYEKQKAKILKIAVPNSNELFKEILFKHITDHDLLMPQLSLDPGAGIQLSNETSEPPSPITTYSKRQKLEGINKRKTLLPTFESTSKRLMKLGKKSEFSNIDDLGEIGFRQTDPNSNSLELKTSKCEEQKEIKLLDPMMYFNTALNITPRQWSTMKERLMGGVRKELILSPYSAIYLKPYIRRDTETYPPWLRLMTEIQVKANQNIKNFVLPPRSSIDYTYIEPEHIPAINSLCNQFFWPGIDLTESLQYPDFSCVAMYKRLIVGFAILVPNVTYTENYISFVFTRPGWRNVGIAKFMIYHLIQTSVGKDITIHVSINNPALVLYQKFGFKVESVQLNFYHHYLRNDSAESKHAFFCRLER